MGAHTRKKLVRYGLLWREIRRNAVAAVVVVINFFFFLVILIIPPTNNDDKIRIHIHNKYHRYKRYSVMRARRAAGREQTPGDTYVYSTGSGLIICTGTVHV